MIALLAVASAFEYLDDCNGTPTHWDIQPSVWNLATPGGAQAYDVLPDTAVTAAVTSGWSGWSDASCCTAWLSEHAGTLDAVADSTDEQNVVYFEHTAWDPIYGDAGLTIAIAIPVYSPTHCGIRTADQIYNAENFTFSAGTDVEAGAVDLQSVAAHENGHWLGLDHSADTTATMFAGATGDITQRVLATDDETAVCTNYPGNCDGPQELCLNGIDDDLDGLTDCFDDACDRDVRCTCPLGDSVGCQEVVQGTTTGGLQRVDDWNAFDRPLPGPETVYRFEVPAGEAGVASFRLRGLTADLEMNVSLLSPTGTCEPSLGVADDIPGLDDERLDLNVEVGEVFAIVIDGPDAAGGDFELEVRCASAPSEVKPCPIQNDIDLDVVISASPFGDSAIDDWSCFDGDLPGPEFPMRFTADQAGDYEVTVTGDVQVFVTPEADGFCAADACDHLPAATSATGASLGTLAAGESVVLVVDGAAATDFEITVRRSAETSSKGCQTGGTPWAFAPLLLLLVRRRG